MGLDITAYSKLVRRSDVVYDEDGEPLNLGDDWWRTFVSIRPNEDFIERADGLKRGYYKFGKSFGFNGGSYTSYSVWRDWLAQLAGYPPSPTEHARHAHSQTVWNGALGPFSELINMSDCEGVIGPVTAAKLAKDFANFDERAQVFPCPEGRDCYAKYKEWRKACELAADGGAIDFH